MPTIEEALQLGWKEHQAGNLRQAEHIYRQVLAVASSNANAWCFLGMACHDQARYDEAVEAYHRALKIQPEFPVVLNNLANTLKQLGRPEEAEASCREALRIKPDYATAYNNLGVALVAQGRLAEAAVTFEQALALIPNDPVTHSNLSAALVRQGKFEEAEVNSQQALRLNPGYAEAHKNQGIVWLLLGNFERGWPEYEWRWRCPGSPLPRLTQPLWDGGPLDGQTILLHHEQGLGDTIQFVRYAEILKQRGARRVVVKTQPALRKLLEGCAGIDALVSTEAELPAFDLYVPMLSVPGLLKTDFSTIPGNVPYLRPDPTLVTHWQQRLAQYPGFRIGIAWQGSADFHADAQRSIPLQQFAPLAAIEGVRLFSLQKGIGEQQIGALHPAFEVIHFGDELDAKSGAFMDTAAIMQNLDLVITSDTSVPHLAGALGVPTWLALSISPDWRWFLERDDSPWYPSMTLFRQQRLGDWEDVFDRIACALRERIATAALHTAVPSTAAPPTAAPSTAAPHTDTPHIDTSHTAAPQQSVTTEPKSTAAAPRLIETGFNCLKRCRHGFMLYNQHDMYIGRSLDKYGEFSEGEIELFQQIVHDGDVVVEVGANIGAHTIALARAVGVKGRVYAFEPQRVVFQTLCANVALNSLSNVECHNVAVGAAPGELFVPPLPPDVETNFGGLGLGEYRTGERRPVVTLDDVGVVRCRLLKIDVEGMEQSVLIGAAELIRHCRPILYVENDRADRSAALIDHIMGLDYRLFWHLPPMFHLANYFGNTENVFGRIVSVNMLCVPRELNFVGNDLSEITGPNSSWQSALPTITK